MLNKIKSIGSRPDIIGAIAFALIFSFVGIYLLFGAKAMSRPIFTSPSNNASTRGVINIKLSVINAKRNNTGKLLVDGVDAGGSIVYSSRDIWTYKSADGTIGFNSASLTVGTHKLVAVINNISSPTLIIQNTAYVGITLPVNGVTYGHNVVFSGNFNTPTPTAAIKLYVDGVLQPGKVLSSSYGWVYQAVDGTYGVNVPTVGKHTFLFKVDDLKSSPVTVNIADAGIVKINLPLAGATVSGTVNISAQIDSPANPYLLVDSKIATGKLVPTANGWLYEASAGVYGLTLAAGSHTLQIINGTQTSTAITVKVSTVTALSTNTTWSDHMGISMSLSRSNVDKAKALGVKWVRISWEQNWGTFDMTSLDYAHTQGLKVLQSCQKAGKTYTATDISSFASYCASWVDKGIDALEIGNEWNHVPFWNPDPNGSYTLQAQLMDATSSAIRAKSSTITIMNSGWSPEATPDTPTEAMSRTLDASNGNLKANGDAIAHHGYAYHCNSPLLCSYPSQTWNAFLYTQNVYAAAKTRGYDHPVWLTEIGGPSGNGNNLYTGLPFTLASQQQLYKDYITGIKQMRTAGTPIDMVFWHTIQDGQSATNSVELTFGLYDTAGVIKPAGQVVKDQAALAW